MCAMRLPSIPTPVYYVQSPIIVSSANGFFFKFQSTALLSWGAVALLDNASFKFRLESCHYVLNVLFLPWAQSEDVSCS